MRFRVIVDGSPSSPELEFGPLPTDGLCDGELAVRIAATGGGTLKLPPGGWTSTDR